jgi:hypothetical protein
MMFTFQTETRGNYLEPLWYKNYSAAWLFHEYAQAQTSVTLLHFQYVCVCVCLHMCVRVQEGGGHILQICQILYDPGK